EVAKFVRDFKYLTKEADNSLDKVKVLGIENECLLRAVVSQDIKFIVQNNSVVDTSNLHTEFDRTKEILQSCIIKKEKEYATLWNDRYKKCKECKYDKISYDKAYNDMQNKIKRLQAQLGDLKGISSNTQCSSNTIDHLSQKVEDENASLEFHFKNYAKENVHLKTTYKNLFDSINTTLLRQEDHHLGEIQRIIGSSLCLSSGMKNKGVDVEEHHRNLLLFKHKIHTSSECKNIKLAIRNDKSEVVCAMCKKCLITANHDVCVLNYVNDMNSRDNNKVLMFQTLKVKRNRSQRNLLTNGFQILSLLLAGYPNLSMKFLGTVRLKNDHITAILGYADLQWGNILIIRVYFVEGLGHNLFSVGQLCDLDLENTLTKGVMERKNQTLVEAARTMLIFLCAPLFLWAEAIATVCNTQNHSIIHRRFNRTPYELINGKKPDISFLHIFGALCYPKNDHEDLGKLGAKVKLDFSLVTLLILVLTGSKPGLQGMISGQISSGLDLTYDPSTITFQKPIECDLDLLFEAMYDYYIGGQLSAATRTSPVTQAHQVLQTPTATTTTINSTPTLTIYLLKRLIFQTLYKMLTSSNHNNNMSNNKLIKLHYNLKLLLTLFQMVCSMRICL
nr:retrovirus-related Pol polyprotein from transposon TNT 1-94 [Tanacetum cinerariifolium]